MLILVLHKAAIIKVIKNIKQHFGQNPAQDVAPNDKNDIAMNDVGIVVDDSMRRNATVVNM